MKTAGEERKGEAEERFWLLWMKYSSDVKIGFKEARQRGGLTRTAVSAEHK